jgi:hypothetical protein
VHRFFGTVAYLPHVQNEWILLKVWIDLMKMSTNSNDIIDKLNTGGFKRVMTSHMSRVSLNLRVISEDG